VGSELLLIVPRFINILVWRQECLEITAAARKAHFDRRSIFPERLVRRLNSARRLVRVLAPRRHAFGAMCSV